MRKTILGALLVIIGSAIAAQATTPDQPFMEAAHADLAKAKTQLQEALRNKTVSGDNHCAIAANLVNQAIREVNAGIFFEGRHNHASSPDQPHMQAALDALNSALNNLKQAKPDKGGHPAKAIDLVKGAIREVNLGIQAGEGG